MKTYTNPSPINNIGDPWILHYKGVYYCYATSHKRGFKVWRSEDLINWEDRGLAFEAPEGYWGERLFWAPEVYNINNKIIMIASIQSSSFGHRLALLEADNPEGPFIDKLGKPMFDLGYPVIDGNLFIDDDGQMYIFFVKDGCENIVEGRNESHIYGMKLNSNFEPASEPVLISKPEYEWEIKRGHEWRLNEGPFVMKKNGRYYLIYSANIYWDVNYILACAEASSPLGPYKKYEDGPVLRYVSDKNGKIQVSGPGHNGATYSPDGRELFCVYHTHTHVDKPSGNRQMNIDRMAFDKNGRLFINGPTIYPQPAASGIDGIVNLTHGAFSSCEAVIDGLFEVNIPVPVWSANKGDKIEITLNGVREVDAVYIYPGRKALDKVSMTIEMADRNYDIEFTPQDVPGYNAVLQVDGVKTSKLIITAGSPTQISEIMVFGK